MKRCFKCGRELPESEFHKSRRSKDGLASCCKECVSRRQREAYARTRKRPAEYVNKWGQLYEVCGIGKSRTARLKWTEDMLRTLREKFPATLNADLAAELMVSPTSLHRKARELGLRKEEGFRDKHAGDIASLIKKGQRLTTKPWATKYRKGHGARRWTQGELYYLRAAYANAGDKELAGLFGCAVQTLRNKAESLGLKKNKTSVRLRKMAAMRKIWEQRKKINLQENERD